MIVVHHLDNSRSQRVLWMLEELGVPYEVKRYERDPKTMLAPRSLKDVHPLGKSPVITDGDVTVAESGAIIEYLSTAYGGGSMIPTVATPAYRECIFWLHYAEGSLMPPLLLRLVFEKVKSNPMPFFIKPVAKMIAGKTNQVFIGPQVKNHLTFVNDHLAQHEWFVGEMLSAADIQMSFPLEASVARGIAGSYPHIQAYVKRYQARPAYQRALEVGGPYDFA
jgi:glutathione S-transferase